MLSIDEDHAVLALDAHVLAGLVAVPQAALDLGHLGVVLAVELISSLRDALLGLVALDALVHPALLGL
eukprot:10306557-Alexandrium_andersonii.AAC.1